MEGLTITDAMLHRAFDAATLARGVQYARRGMVSEVAVTPTGEAFEITATVRGQRWEPYRTTVAIHRDGRLTHARCSCPVGFDCKHAAAALALVRSVQSQRPTPAVPTWQRALDALLAETESQAEQPLGRTGVGLRFELPASNRRQWKRGSEEHLWLRVVRAAQRGTWAKGGINWAHAEQPALDDVHDRTQLEAVGRLLRGVSGAGARDVLNLATIGPGFVDRLLEAQAAGVSLVGGERVSTVSVAEASVDLTLDVVTEGAATQVRCGVWYDDEFATGEQLFLLGRRPHTVGLIRPVRAHTTAAQPKVNLLVAPLARAVPETLVELHRRHAAVEIPTEARAEFERRYLPRLSRQLPVASSDGSFEVSQEAPPRLVLDLSWADAQAQLSWAWHYPDGTVVALDDAQVSRTRRPGVERSLKAQVAEFRHLQPHTELTRLQTVLFMDDELPRLRAHVGVEVRETGEVPVFRAAVGEADISFAASQSPVDSGATDWLDLAVVVMVDGEQVPMTDLLSALTTGQEQLVLASGLVVSTDRPEFRRLADLVAAAAQIRGDGGEGMRVARGDLGLWHDLAEVGQVDARAEEWVAAARALIGRETLPHVMPVGVQSTLRSYQVEGVRWLAHLWSLGLGGILADDMGLGKTLQTLALISHARAQGADPFLVVAPTSVMSAWAHEAERHTPGLKVTLLDSSEQRRGTSVAEAIAGADLVVTSYTVLRLEADAHAALSWGGVVLDEAQAIKNHRSRTHQAVRRLQAPFRLAVTGTPFENRLLELWSLLSVVTPGLYPSAQRFTEQVVTPVEKQGDPVAAERFRSRIRPFVLRRTKDVVAQDLPAKQEQVLEVVLEPKHRRLYDTWLQRERQAILGLVDDFDSNRVAIFTALTRLRQLSLDPALVDEAHEGVGSAKLDALAEHLVELAAEGHRALVFSQFTSFLTRARTRLEAEGLTCRYLDGSTVRRREEIEAFKAGDGDAFLISLKAGGVGLTLTEADYVFVLDPWWNPAAEAQAVDRAHRIGQHRPVMVYRMVSQGTIEEKVMALKERKAALFESVFSGEGAVGTGIDAADVRALFE